MEQEIIKCEENFLHALKNSDAETLANTIHDDVIYNNATGEVLDKEMDVQGFKLANPVIESVECIERKVQLFGDTAIVSTVIYLKGLFMGNVQVDGKSRFLRTWKKFGNEWKIIGAASINLAE